MAYIAQHAITRPAKPVKRFNQIPQTNSPYQKALAVSQNAYAERKYSEALQHLVCLGTCTIADKDVEDQLQVLDLRCMILVKLNSLDSAIATAKSMIRLDKHNASGFCRLASIEGLRGNWSSAMQFLEYGKKRVSKSDKLRSHLLLQFDKVQRRLLQESGKNKLVDPMIVLPLELLQMVLSYFEYAQVVTMLRVSRAWGKVLSKLAPLTTSMDFRSTARPISHFMLKAALDRLVCPKLIAINKLSATAAETMNKRLCHWKRLTTLEFLWTDAATVPRTIMTPEYDKMKLKYLYFGTGIEVDIGTIYRLLSKCPLAQEAHFMSVTNGLVNTVNYQNCLKTLELRKSNSCPDLTVPTELFQLYPSLRSLSIKGCSASIEDPTWDLSENRELRVLDMDRCIMWSLRLPGSLQKWAWGGHPSHSSTGPVFIAPQTFLSLDSISLSGQNTMPILQYLCDSGVRDDQLTTMALHHGPKIDAFVNTNRAVKLLCGVLDLSFGCEDLVDDDAEVFNVCFPNLRTLHLTAPRITGAFIADVLKRNSRIFKMTLVNCRGVLPDTINWARARGVETRVHLTSIDSLGGQRVHGYFG